MKPASISAVLATVGLALLVASSVAAQLKSPDEVKTALGHLAHESNDVKRRIIAMDFPRIPREYMEYTEAADALRSAIRDEPADFKAKVETRLNAAVVAEQKVSDMSANTSDADKIMAEQGKAVTTMNAVFELFPADLRPDPNTPSGRRMARN